MYLNCKWLLKNWFSMGFEPNALSATQLCLSISCQWVHNYTCTCWCMWIDRQVCKPVLLWSDLQLPVARRLADCTDFCKDIAGQHHVPPENQRHQRPVILGWPCNGGVQR